MVRGKGFEPFRRNAQKQICLEPTKGQDILLENKIHKHMFACHLGLSPARLTRLRDPLITIKRELSPFKSFSTQF